jgi:hypothetical protein
MAENFKQAQDYISAGSQNPQVNLSNSQHGQHTARNVSSATREGQVKKQTSSNDEPQISSRLA